NIRNDVYCGIAGRGDATAAARLVTALAAYDRACNNRQRGIIELHGMLMLTLRNLRRIATNPVPPSRGDWERRIINSVGIGGIADMPQASRTHDRSHELPDCSRARGRGGAAGASQRPERGRADRRAAGASEGDPGCAHPADAGITRSAALAG